MKKLEAVIFDMDGVLCATEESHYLSWKRMADAKGIPFTREDNENLRGLSRPSSLEWILQGRSFSEAQKEEMLEEKDRYFQVYVQKMSPTMLSAGVESLLKELCKEGLKVGVASASRNVKAILRQLGIDAYIQAYCDGYSVLVSKPAPDVYLCAASALEVPPSACLAIEDSQAGIQAALEAGMCVVGLGPPERVKKAHAVYRDLSGVHLEDLQKVFQKWRAHRGGFYRFLSLP